MSIANLTQPNNYTLYVDGTVTGNVTASGLYSGSSGNIVSVSAAANPTAGQVLTATSSTTATWQDAAGPDDNVTHGGFSGVGAAGAGTTLTTVTITEPGAYLIEGLASCNINTGTVSSGYIPKAVFHIPLAGGAIVKDGDSNAVVFEGGALTGEGSPTWEIDTATTIKLAKTGTVNSVWGGTWRLTKSGTV